MSAHFHLYVFVCEQKWWKSTVCIITKFYNRMNQVKISSRLHFGNSSMKIDRKTERHIEKTDKQLMKTHWVGGAAVLGKLLFCRRCWQCTGVLTYPLKLIIMVILCTCRCCVWHRLLQLGRHGSTEAQVSRFEWQPDTGLPRVAHHHHALCVPAVCQHSAAQPAHSYLQVRPPTHFLCLSQAPCDLRKLSLCYCTALLSRRFRTTQTGYGSFKDTSSLRSTTAALLPLRLSSSSVISTSLSGAWCCASPTTQAKSSVSIHALLKVNFVLIPRVANMRTNPFLWHCFSEIPLPENEEEELLSWEALMKDRYLLSTQQEQNQNMERRILDTAQKYKRFDSSCPTVLHGFSSTDSAGTHFRPRMGWNSAIL